MRSLVEAGQIPVFGVVRVQRLDVARMAERLEDAVPVEIRLETAQPGALRAAPLTVGLQAERHEGYAAQWFALAGVLIVGYAVYGLRGAQRSRRLNGRTDESR